MYFIANWKMNLGVDESAKLAKEIKKGSKSADIVLCPSFEAIEEVSKVLKNSKIGLGAQDMFWEGKGAFTGEISPLNLKKMGCSFVILGHSERRKLGETDEDVRKKLLLALEIGLFPIICVGETLAERKAGKTKDIITKQVTAIFKNIKLGTKKIIIAYEPVWAIGTGVPAHPRDAAQARDLIFKLLSKYLPSPHPSPSPPEADPPWAEKRGRVREGEQIAVIYGGSVTAKNIGGFLKEGKMEGALVGGASLEAKEFIKIVNSYKKLK